MVRVTPKLMKGHEYRGYVYVDQKALRTQKGLRFLVNLSLDYLLVGANRRKGSKR